MKKIIYLYILETMAEWEVSYMTQALSMQKVLNTGKQDFEIKTVAFTEEPIRTIGGLTIIPDCVFSDIDKEAMIALLLPGADDWNNQIHKCVLAELEEFGKNDVLIGAICGATIMLANRNMLDKRSHTSNSLEYLKYLSESYNGSAYFRNEPAIRDGNIVTASSAGSLLWAKLILEYLDVFDTVRLEAWYNYYKTGEVKYYFEMIS